MKRKWLIVLMGGLVLLGIVASGALASQGVDIKSKGSRFRAYIHPERGRYEIRMMPHRKSEMEAAGVLSGLSLTAEQQKEIARLQVDFQKDILELRFRLEEKQLELRKLLLKDSPDEEEIEALVDEMGTIWAETRKESINFRMKLKDVLTEEQWAKLGGMGSGSFAPGTRHKQKLFHRLW